MWASLRLLTAVAISSLLEQVPDSGSMTLQEELEFLRTGRVGGARTEVVPGVKARG